MDRSKALMRALQLVALALLCSAPWTSANASFPVPGVWKYQFAGTSSDLNPADVECQHALPVEQNNVGSGSTVSLRGPWANPSYVEGGSAAPHIGCQFKYVRKSDGHVDDPVNRQFSGSSKIFECPANATLSNGQCTCTAPYVEKNTGGAYSCISADEAVCNLAASTGTADWASTVGRPTRGSTTCMENGCQAVWQSTVTYTNKATGVVETEGNVTFTGSTCSYTPSQPTSASPDQCKGGSFGQVNGVSVCVKYDPSMNTTQSSTKDTTTSTKTETPAGGGTPTTSTETRETTTETKCDAGKCTTTTTTTTTKGDGSTSTETKTDEQTQGGFCEVNPKHEICKADEQGSFSGTCQTDFVCTGGPIECAIGRAVNKTVCHLDPGTGTDLVKGQLENGTFGPSLPEKVKNIGQFDQTNPFNGSCPGNQSLQLHGMTFVIPLGDRCSELQMLGNALVVFTLLAATIFVVRGIGG